MIAVWDEAECRKAFIVVGAVATAVMVALSLWVAPAGSTYKFSFAILGPILWLLYFLRRRLALHPLHFSLFATALLLHNLGALGYYRREFFSGSSSTCSSISISASLPGSCCIGP